MKVFITGGAGMIGSHVAELLLARGDKVMVMDNVETAKKRNLKVFDYLILDQILLNGLFYYLT